MFAHKTLLENVDPHSKVMGPKNKKKGVDLIKVADAAYNGVQAKMKKPAIGQVRRAAFGDITNATQEQSIENVQKTNMELMKPMARGNKSSNKTNKILTKKRTINGTSSLTTLPQNSSISSNTSSSSSITDEFFSSQESSFEHTQKSLADGGLPTERVEEDISFVIADESNVEAGADSNVSMNEVEAEKSLPSVDLENYSDVFNVGIYAQHIFDYYKRREKMFEIPAYLKSKECRITPLMRAILIDWMVEIQENFELNHETLYLAVKLTDKYLSHVPVDKELLQLLGAASIFIASKFDERSPPLIEDFTFICDNAFDRDHLISMEIKLLKTVDFDLGIPISYRFLRRYAKVARMSIETLTLARYILELSLMECDLVTAKESMKAAAALYIAQKMRSEGSWDGELVTSSGYTTTDIKDLIVALNTMLLSRPASLLTTIRSKYSHEVFHSVARIAPLPTKDLLLPCLYECIC